VIAALTGLLAGFIHVFSGPDHLTAIAPLALRRGKRAWMPGVRWGIGHSAGRAVVGLLSLWLRSRLPVDLLSSWGDRIVGVMLFGIGLWALRHALRGNVHAHEHEHEPQGEPHVHLHVHEHGHEPKKKTPHQHTHAAFAIGALHGLAGSSHVLGILPMLALPTAAQAVTYLAAFAVGTIAAMAGFSYGFGWLAVRYAKQSILIYRGIMATCSAAAMTVGGLWLSGYSW
jgi:ABC-type nickel/cobalt efflux system permease component RcnA